MPDPSPQLEKLLNEKRVAFDMQSKRHDNWESNHSLYRGKVQINRLTQRQAVHIPLMKETIKTILSKIDEPPEVDWEELSGDEQKELIFQEIWNQDSERLDFEGIDIQDKKNALLYGRGVKKISWSEEGLFLQELDPYDFLVDPLTNPLNLQSARFVIHQNIFRRLRDILADERYDKDARRELQQFLVSPPGQAVVGVNQEDFQKKVERLRSLGISDQEFAHFGAGDTIVKLTEHVSETWSTSKKKFERRVFLYANDTILLLDELLEDLIGIERYPYVTWGEDMETVDFWTDAIADLVRPANLVANVWFSQLVENRTLRNFQMHWYDATRQGYVPQTYEPGPGRMLPAPGNPNETIRPVEVSGLEETLTAMEFIIRMVERGTSATAIEKGVSEKKQITLGEVRTLVGKALERTVAMTKFYRRSWFDLAQLYHDLLEANERKSRTLAKTSPSGKVYKKVIAPSEWKSGTGYRPVVRGSAEREEEKTTGVQRLLFVKTLSPQNAALTRITLQRGLEILDLTPAEMQEVESAEKDVQKQQAIAASASAPGAPQAQATDQVQEVQRVRERVNELESLANA